MKKVFMSMAVIATVAMLSACGNCCSKKAAEEPVEEAAVEVCDSCACADSCACTDSCAACEGCTEVAE